MIYQFKKTVEFKGTKFDVYELVDMTQERVRMDLEELARDNYYDR